MRHADTLDQAGDEPMKLKHEGISKNRLQFNPKERIFADAWTDQNRIIGRSAMTIEWLLHPTDGMPVTQEECTVAATMMQWLGSPVGFNFLEDALKSAGYELVRKT